MTSLFVTGFDGFIGSHVVSVLRHRQVHLHVLARDEESASRAKSLGLEPHRVALDDLAKLTEIARRVDGIAHLAASENPAFLPLNESATNAMLDGLAGGAPFVMQGGSMVFGDTGAAGAPATPAFNPPPPLAARAAFDERVLARSRNGVRTHVTYGSLVFGGRGAMIPNALVAAAQRASYSGYPGNGQAVWSAVHVEDWADLIARVLLDGKTSGQAVFPAAQEITIRAVADAVAAAFTPALPVRTVDPEESLALWSFFGPALAMNQRFDGSVARAAYGWSPPVRDIAAELSRLASQR